MSPLFLWIMYDSPFVPLSQCPELYPSHLPSMPHCSDKYHPQQVSICTVIHLFVSKFNHVVLPTMYRVVQSLVAAVLRVYPERARTERERAQADEIYTAGREILVRHSHQISAMILSRSRSRLHEHQTPMSYFPNNKTPPMTTLHDLVPTGAPLTSHSNSYLT